MQLKLFSASAALAQLAFLQASSAEPVERAAVSLGLCRHTKSPYSVLNFHSQGQERESREEKKCHLRSGYARRGNRYLELASDLLGEESYSYSMSMDAGSMSMDAESDMALESELLAEESYSYSMSMDAGSMSMDAESDMALESELLAEESYSYSMSYCMSMEESMSASKGAVTDAAATPELKVNVTPELKVNAPAMEIA
ncbi:hypothetical protein THAOC_19183 [Thalassiosira oceanica]|uniref:Uncharacterized protein n=1 Tax=Thalassiosira oceanica TaxID=159749 RepID=K0S2X5_THAOC|nr:hypothetical protein THAOC_19183 [Thalassiosira oceanica]|eukprot:EJK60463.1 hypothetical protein THAOC_19183 [Thalassiosira oceanica]